MQVKTTVRHHFTPSRLLGSDKRATTNWQGCGEIRPAYRWECKTAKQLWKLIWQFLKRLVTILPGNSEFLPFNPCPGV